jgi:hypothetical protein
MSSNLGRYTPEQLILKISLIGSRPKIWRRVEVHSGMTLYELHFVIQCIFGWDHSHLFQFLVTPGGALTREALREAVRYDQTPPDGPREENTRPAEEEIIGRIFAGNRRQVVYEYDFGDSWEHLIVLERRTPGGDIGFVPICLAGKNAGPGDDRGGIPGYYMWLEAIQDPNNAQHEEAKEQFPDDFDPAAFDIDEANRLLSQTFNPKGSPKPKRTKKGP